VGVASQIKSAPVKEQGIRIKEIGFCVAACWRVGQINLILIKKRPAQLLEQLFLYSIIPLPLEFGGCCFCDPFQMRYAAWRQTGMDATEDGVKIILKRGALQEAKLPTTEIERHQLFKGESDRW